MLEGVTGQCVTIPGTMRMPLSSAYNSDSHVMVNEVPSMCPEHL